jgi:FkbM family methyltransferase
MGYKITPINSALLKVNKAAQDQKMAFPDQKMLVGQKDEVVIFDVGAHHGQTALKYNSLFKNCQIYAFEPFIDSFNILKDNVSIYKNVKAFNLALSKDIGQVAFNLNSSSGTNSILPTSIEAATTWDKNVLETAETIQVNSTTLDDFIAKKNISQIDILKLDTQGSEYLVIEGAIEYIKKGKIKLIYMEIILMPTYVGQKHFDEILKLLRTNNFTLFGIYNNNYSANGKLRQIDAIFIHQK